MEIVGNTKLLEELTAIYDATDIVYQLAVVEEAPGAHCLLGRVHMRLFEHHSEIMILIRLEH